MKTDVDTTPRGAAVHWNAADYAANSGAQQSWAQDLLGRVVLRGNEKVLDLGCGDGKITAAIAARVPAGSAVGLDKSPDMIAFARKSHGAAQNLSFAVGDAAALTYHRQFDLVFSNAALHWIKDHRSVLAGIARALVPGGRFVVSMGGRGNADAVVAAVNSLITREPWAAWFVGFEFPYGFHGPENYRQWAEAAGLVIDRAELVPKPMPHQRSEDLAAWFRTTWLPWTNRVPEAQRERFISEMVATYGQAQAAQDADTLRVEMIRLEVEGHAPKREG